MSIFIDLEMNTTDARLVHKKDLRNEIIEIGAVRVTDGKIVDKFSTFVNPEVPIPYDIEQLTSINDGW